MLERLKWLEHALQGMAFWIGYRHSYFRSWPLVEGALVAEACNLIQANLPSEFILIPECMYKNLVSTEKSNEGWSTTRADLVICSREAKCLNRDENISKYTKFVVEVKRGSATDTAINEDIQRLHKFLKFATKNTRCFLFVIYESRIPSGVFVKNGKAIRKNFEIPGTSGNGYFRLRRVMKASASFNANSTSAHYVCLFEVFLKDQNESSLPPVF